MPNSNKDTTPKWVMWICGTALALGALAALTFLIYTDKETTQISAFVNTLLNFLALVGIGGVGIGVTQAARKAEEAKESADTAVQNTNGVLKAHTARMDRLEDKQDG